MTPVAPSSGPIAELWSAEDGKRRLEAPRECSALVSPGTLPAEGHVEGDALPRGFQTIGPLGLANLEGKFNAALYPPDFPHFDLDISPESLYDPRIPDELKQAVQQRLFLLRMQVWAMMESSGQDTGARYSGMGFRSHKRRVINSILVTGEALEHLDDKYRFRMFRRDQYVTRRDQCGDVLYHVVRELKDPLSLDEKSFAKSGLKRADLEALQVQDRQTDLYTKVAWQHQTKKWTISQELNGQEINTMDEELSPYFSTTFDLVNGENNGRGYIEKLAPELRTLNELELRFLDMMGAASRVNPAIDHSSQVRDTDLTKPSGKPIRCRVVNGVVQDVAFLGYPNIREFQMLSAGIDRRIANLSRAFLIESQSIPNQDRVTRYQVFRIAQEIEGITGGFYTPVADQQQVPQVRRFMWQMKRDKLININLPDKAMRITAYTGAASLARANRSNDLMEFTTAVAALGETAMGRIDTGVLMNVLARYKNIAEPGLIKSDEQLKKEQQEMMAMAAQAKAIDVTGNIAEANATK